MASAEQWGKKKPKVKKASGGKGGWGVDYIQQGGGEVVDSVEDAFSEVFSDGESGSEVSYDPANDGISVVKEPQRSDSEMRARKSFWKMFESKEGFGGRATEQGFRLLLETGMNAEERELNKTDPEEAMRRWGHRIMRQRRPFPSFSGKAHPETGVKRREMGQLGRASTTKGKDLGFINHARVLKGWTHDEAQAFYSAMRARFSLAPEKGEEILTEILTGEVGSATKAIKGSGAKAERLEGMLKSDAEVKTSWVSRISALEALAHLPKAQGGFGATTFKARGVGEKEAPEDETPGEWAQKAKEKEGAFWRAFRKSQGSAEELPAEETMNKPAQVRLSFGLQQGRQETKEEWEARRDAEIEERPELARGFANEGETAEEWSARLEKKGLVWENETAEEFKVRRKEQMAKRKSQIEEFKKEKQTPRGVRKARTLADLAKVVPENYRGDEKAWLRGERLPHRNEGLKNYVPEEEFVLSPDEQWDMEHGTGGLWLMMEVMKGQQETAEAAEEAKTKFQIGNIGKQKTMKYKWPEAPDDEDEDTEGAEPSPKPQPQPPPPPSVGGAMGGGGGGGWNPEPVKVLRAEPEPKGLTSVPAMAVASPKPPPGSLRAERELAGKRWAGLSQAQKVSELATQPVGEGQVAQYAEMFNEMLNRLAMEGETTITKEGVKPYDQFEATHALKGTPRHDIALGRETGGVRNYITNKLAIQGALTEAGTAGRLAPPIPGKGGQPDKKLDRYTFDEQFFKSKIATGAKKGETQEEALLVKNAKGRGELPATTYRIGDRLVQDPKRPNETEVGYFQTTMVNGKPVEIFVIEPQRLPSHPRVPTKPVRITGDSAPSAKKKSPAGGGGGGGANADGED